MNGSKIKCLRRVGFYASYDASHGYTGPQTAPVFPFFRHGMPGRISLNALKC